MKNPFLRQLISGDIPPAPDVFHAFLDRVMNGDVSKSEVTAFLAGLSAKPLNAANVSNFVSHVFQISPAKQLAGGEHAVNIVGTGGGISTFNISTAVAFVASAAGAKVLKSGSAAYNSQCGSLDVLDGLGVMMPDSETMLAEMLDQLGIGFVPAAYYGELLRRLAIHILPLQFRDIAGFVNIVGPLLCPYRVAGQLIGVGRFEYLDIFTDVLSQRGAAKTLLVHADCAMDEFSSLGVNHCRLIDDGIQRFSLSSRNLGFGRGCVEKLAGGDVKQNCMLLRQVLTGQRRDEARDTVVLNSAALLFIAGIVRSIEAGIELAAQTIDDGKAVAQLQRVLEWSARRRTQRVADSAA